MLLENSRETLLYFSMYFISVSSEIASGQEFISNIPHDKCISMDIKNNIINFFEWWKTANININFRWMSMEFYVQKRFLQETGDVAEKSKSEWPRKTSSYQDKQILKISKNESILGSTKNQSSNFDTLGLHVCSRTLRSRLIEVTLFFRRPAKKNIDDPY